MELIMLRNKDGSNFKMFTKSVPEMEQQSFWNKKERIIVHNKFGERYFREEVKQEWIKEEEEQHIEREAKLPDFKEIEKQREDTIKIVQAIEESKSKHINEDVVNVWCLPCLDYSENTDLLYDESYAKTKYGETFIFKARIAFLEDLYIQFVTELDVVLLNHSVIYPKIKSKRWWRIKDRKESKGFNVYLGEISDYQPSFDD